MPHSTTRSNFCRISSANAANALTCCAIILPTLSQPNRSVISGVAGAALPTGGARAPNRLGTPAAPRPPAPPAPPPADAPPPPRARRRGRAPTRLALCGDHAKQRLEGVGELIDPLRFEHAGDVPEVDRGRPEVIHGALRVRGVAGKGFTHGAVVFEQLERLRR